MCFWKTCEWTKNINKEMNKYTNQILEGNSLKINGPKKINSVQWCSANCWKVQSIMSLIYIQWKCVLTSHDCIFSTFNTSLIGLWVVSEYNFFQILSPSSRKLPFKYCLSIWNHSAWHTYTDREGWTPGAVSHTHDERLSLQCVAFVTVELKSMPTRQVVLVHFSIQ